MSSSAMFSYNPNPFSRSFAREPDTSPQKWSLPPTFSKSNPAWSFSVRSRPIDKICV